MFLDVLGTLKLHIEWKASQGYGTSGKDVYQVGLSGSVIVRLEVLEVRVGGS